jgi:hypothetical protein
MIWVFETPEDWIKYIYSIVSQLPMLEKMVDHYQSLTKRQRRRWNQIQRNPARRAVFFI